MRQFDQRRIDAIASRIEALLQQEHTGVVALPYDEYRVAAATWPRAEGNENGVLLVLAQPTIEEWKVRHSPGPPVRKRRYDE